MFLMALLCFVSCNNKVSESVSDSDYPIWIEMMEEPDVNMNDARLAFDAYWANHTHHKGDRSKQFERWYAIQSKRLDESGHVISPTVVKKEFQRMRSYVGGNQEGQWFNYGPLRVGPRPNGDQRDGGRVKHISFHPEDLDTYYISCFKSGSFKTENGGKTWTPLTDHLIEETYISAVDPSDPETIYLGSNLGVLKSTDGGNTWDETGLTTEKTKGLLIKSDEPDVILAGNDSGIFKSEDGGVHFMNVLTAPFVEEIKSHPEHPEILYAGTNGNPSQFFRSEDGGDTWTEIEFEKGAFMKIATTKAKPNYVYVINSRDHLGDDSFEGVYLSKDSGQTFTKQSGQSPCITGYSSAGEISRGQPNYNLFIVADQEDENLIYAGGVKAWKSTDGGVSWTQSFDQVTTLGFGLHLDQLSWAYQPGTNKLFAVNDGGIYFLNEDNLFEPITDGLPIAEVWECTQSQTNRSNVAGGTFHCGIKLNRGGSWYSPWGGDEATVLFDYSDDNYAYHFKYDKIHRSTDGGFSFQRINSTTANRGYYTGTGVLDKSDVNVLYVGLFEVERTQNARAENTQDVSWTKISTFGGNQRIEKIEQADANHEIMYVSREGNRFFRSENVRSAQPTFTDITSKLPASGKVTDIATHPTNDGIVYILLGSKIYKSEDKGETWKNISDGLPGVALLEMILDKSSDEGIYVGTDIGVYYKDNSMSEWIDYSKGLPVIRVAGMDIYYGESRTESLLTIATDGRGFWRSMLYGEEAVKPNADFSSEQEVIIKGNSMKFKDESSGNPIRWEWEFEGGNPSKSNDESPVIFYDEIGKYKVKLKVFTTSDTSSIEKTDFIEVTEHMGMGNLQAHYTFDATTADSSSYQRNLAEVGNFTPMYVRDKNNNYLSALELPGKTGNYLTNSYKGIGGNGPRTVTAWIKTSTVGSRKTIVSWGENLSGEMFNVMVHNGNIRVEAGSCNVQNANSEVTRLDNNEWRHIAVTYDPDNGALLKDIKLYIDGKHYENQPDSGESYNSESISINTDAKVNNIQIGNASYNGSYFWIGELDDIRVYDIALDQVQIEEIMNDILVHTKDYAFSRSISISPNPVQDQVIIKTDIDEEFTVKVFSQSGVMVKDQKFNGRSSILNLSKITPGIYFVQVNTATSKSCKKIIKQ